MKSGLFKEFKRELGKSMNRFVSISLIVALGVGFFVGVKAASPSMKYSANAFFKQNNLMDYHIFSDYGFTNEDVKTLATEPGVLDVMPSYSGDFLVANSEGNSVVRVHALPSETTTNKNVINSVRVVEGRLPNKSGECVVESAQNLKGGYKVGDYVTFISPDQQKNINDILKVNTYKIVGLVDSPQYISFDRGISQVGDGMIRLYMMILPEDFNYERYSEVYVNISNNTNLKSSFESKYNKNIEKFTSSLHRLEKERLQVNYDSIILAGQEKLDKARAELTAKISEINDKFAKSQLQIDNGFKQIAMSQKELDKAESDLAAARIKLDESAKKISQGEAELAAGKKEYETNLAKYNKEYAAYQVQRADAVKKIESGKQQLAMMKQALDEAENVYDSMEANPNDPAAATLESVLNSLKNNPNFDISPEDESKMNDIINQIKKNEDPNNPTLNKDVLPQFRTELDKLQADYKAKEAEIAAAEKQIADADKKFADAKKELDAAKVKLDNAEADLNNGKAELAKGEKEYMDGMAKVKQGRTDAKNGLIRLNKSLKDLEKARINAQLEIDSAQQKIDNSQKDLDNLSMGKWYIMNRTNNPGYSSFEDDANRIDAIATVFPLFFFLVAALVCLTTMTRMVEEQRLQIGTLKALGYTNAKISAKYFFYALIATLIGSAIGIALGLYFLPRVIFDSYKAMYMLPDFYVDFHWNTIIWAVFGALLSTCTVALIIVLKVLKDNSATLMRPKAPKAGKRIFLENIPFIWKGMNFTSKVTARNILRYKARFIMTIMGIAGCTALILAAYGLKDDISIVVPKQYGEIFAYDTMMTLKYDGSYQEKDLLRRQLAADERIDSSFLAHQSIMDGTNSANVKPVEVRLFVPDDINTVDNFILFREKASGKTIEFNQNSVIITDKLAKMLNLTSGDTITVKDNDNTLSLVVTDVVENYVFNYVYISPDLYNAKTGNEVLYNTVFSKLTDAGKSMEKEIGEYWLKNDDVLVMTFMDDIINNFENQIASLNQVVFVMIVCAAALAFIVLYNLTNINVAERTREIATIKVLGFTKREASNYIYRENIVLSIFGIIVGSIVGIYLSYFIVSAIEMDVVTFGRKINAISYLYAALFTLGFTLLVNLAMNKRLNNINMVESLKSIE